MNPIMIRLPEGVREQLVARWPGAGVATACRLAICWALAHGAPWPAPGQEQAAETPQEEDLP